MANIQEKINSIANVKSQQELENIIHSLTMSDLKYIIGSEALIRMPRKKIDIQQEMVKVLWLRFKMVDNGEDVYIPGFCGLPTLLETPLINARKSFNNAEKNNNQKATQSVATVHDERFLQVQKLQQARERAIAEAQKEVDIMQAKKLAHQKQIQDALLLNFDYDTCFDEICYVPDFQENIAVLQDIPQNHVFISKSQKRKAAINPKLDITRFHEGLTYQNKKTFVWKQSKSTTKMKIIASFTVIKRRAKTLVVKTQANEKMTLYLRVVNGCEVALLWDKDFISDYWHLKTTDIISKASEIEEAIEIQELEERYSRIHEDRKFVKGKFYTLNGVLYEVIKTFSVNHKRYVMLWNNKTNSYKDYPVMEYKHYEAVYLNEERTMILCAANPLRIIDTDISEHFVCNPESTIDYDVCFDEDCYVPDYQENSVVLDDSEIDKQPQSVIDNPVLNTIHQYLRVNLGIDNVSIAQKSLAQKSLDTIYEVLNLYSQRKKNIPLHSFLEALRKEKLVQIAVDMGIYNISQAQGLTINQNAKLIAEFITEYLGIDISTSHNQIQSQTKLRVPKFEPCPVCKSKKQPYLKKCSGNNGKLRKAGFWSDSYSQWVYYRLKCRDCGLEIEAFAPNKKYGDTLSADELEDTKKAVIAKWNLGLYDGYEEKFSTQQPHVIDSFVCNPESTIDYDACFDEECFIPDFQENSAVLDDSDLPFVDFVWNIYTRIPKKYFDTNNPALSSVQSLREKLFDDIVVFHKIMNTPGITTDDFITQYELLHAKNYEFLMNGILKHSFQLKNNSWFLTYMTFSLFEALFEACEENDNENNPIIQSYIFDNLCDRYVYDLVCFMCSLIVDKKYIPSDNKECFFYILAFVYQYNHLYRAQCLNNNHPQCVIASKLKKIQLESFYLKPRKYAYERKAYQDIKRRNKEKISNAFSLEDIRDLFLSLSDVEMLHQAEYMRINVSFAGKAGYFKTSYEVAEEIAKIIIKRREKKANLEAKKSSVSATKTSCKNTQTSQQDISTLSTQQEIYEALCKLNKKQIVKAVEEIRIAGQKVISCNPNRLKTKESLAGYCAKKIILLRNLEQQGSLSAKSSNNALGVAENVKIKITCGKHNQFVFSFDDINKAVGNAA